MSAVGHVLGKKFSPLLPLMVEGKIFKSIYTCFQQIITYQESGICCNQFFTILDRKLGYGCRCILWRHTKTKENQVMFFPFSHSVGCNLKYISDELIRRQAPVEIWWSVTNPLTARIDAAEIVSKNYEVNENVLRLAGGHRVFGKKLEEWLSEQETVVKAPSKEERMAARGIRMIDAFVEEHVRVMEGRTVE